MIIVDSFELRMVLPFALGVALVPLTPCGLFAAHLHGRREAAGKAADARSVDRRVATEALAKRCRLSNREANALLYLSLGYSVNRMEETLRITVSTVAVHSRSIRKNMDPRNKQEVIDIANEIMASRTESQNPRCFDARPPSARQYPAEQPQI